jgi:hypothetical protein
MGKVLFISGSHGLGHVGRDIEMAKELRKLLPGTEIEWLADHPASDVLREVGEKVLPEAEEMDYGAAHVDGSGQRYELNIGVHGFDLRKGQPLNAKKVLALIAKGSYDLVVGDETYDLYTALWKDRSLKTFKLIGIGDFIGMDPMSWNLKDRLACKVFNKVWSESMMMNLDHTLMESYIMIGVPEDINEEPFGKSGMTRRELALKVMDFVGYIVSFDPHDYLDQKQVKSRLGYGPGPLIVCTIGGTAAGRDLLELCGKSYPMLKQEFPDLRMLLVCGPRLAQSAIKVPEGVEVMGYVPKLYEHMAAADVTVTAGGGTTTLELTALKRPFLYFPFEHHCEQMIDVANRVKRQRAGVQMRFPQTTPELLALRIKENMGKKVDYAEVPLDGAKKSAEIMSKYLK